MTAATERRLSSTSSNLPNASKPRVQQVSPGGVSTIVHSTLQPFGGMRSLGTSAGREPVVSNLRSQRFLWTFTPVLGSKPSVDEDHLDQSSVGILYEAISMVALRVAIRPLTSTPGFSPRVLTPSSVWWGSDK